MKKRIYFMVILLALAVKSVSCMGPCSQKLAEHNGFSHKICTRASMDISLDEYLLMEFEKRISICGYNSFK